MTFPCGACGGPLSELATVCPKCGAPGPAYLARLAARRRIGRPMQVVGVLAVLAGALALGGWATIAGFVLIAIGTALTWR